MVQGSAQSPEDRDRSAGSAPGTLHEVGRYGGYGLTLGAATALFTWLGNLLDGRVHTTPAFTIVGALAGFAGGFYAMYRDLVLRPSADSRGASEDGQSEAPEGGRSVAAESEAVERGPGERDESGDPERRESESGRPGRGSGAGDPARG